MRQYIDANMRIDYPETLMWLLDNNFVRCENSYGHFKLSVKIDLIVGGIVTTYSNTSEIGDITFRLNPYLRGLANGTNVTVDVVATAYDSANNQHNTLLNFSAKLVYGKTLQERHHGSEGIVVYEKSSDLNNLDILKPAGWTGVIFIGNNFVNYNSTDPDVVQRSYSFGPKIILYSGSGSPILRGEIWNDASELSWDVRCVQVCPARNGIKLEYYNTDGCKRFAIGEVLKKTMSAERKEYRNGGVVYDEPPKSLVTGYAGTIEVGFRDVDPLQYLEDIMLSPIVTTKRGSEQISVIPTTLQLVRDGETKDIVITFKIDA